MAAPLLGGHVRRVAILILVLLGGCGWTQARYDAGNTGHNPVERTITPANVQQLVPKYQMVSSIPDGVPTFVVAHGHVFIDGGPVLAFDEFGNDRCSGQPSVCAPQWSYATGRFPTVVDNVLYLQSEAFDPNGERNCSGVPKRCTRLWYESATTLPPGPLDPARMHLGFLTTTVDGSETRSVRGFPTTCTGPQCAPVWTGVLGTGRPGGVAGGPARVGSAIYASYSAVGATSSSVAAFDGSDPAAPRLWTGFVPAVTGAVIAVADGVAIVDANTSNGYVLFAFDSAGNRNCAGSPKMCLPLWQTDPVTFGPDAPPAIANGVVYRVVNGQLRAYDAAGNAGCGGSPRVCQRLWIADAGYGATAPAVANGLVFTSTNHGFLEAYDARGLDGCSATTRVCAPLWTANVNITLGSVEVADGRVFVAAGDGSIRAFGLP
jgi:hypothetical protein